MHKHIKLTNERLSIVDLSPLLDVEGQRLVLQPKGSLKSTKECDVKVLEHPHVIGYLNAKPPWLSWSPVVVEETSAEAPSAPAEPPKEPEKAAEKEPEKEPEAPVEPPTPPVEEIPVATESTSDEEQDGMATVETTDLSETVETGESLSLEVTTPSSSDSRSGKRNRNR